MSLRGDAFRIAIIGLISSLPACQATTPAKKTLPTARAHAAPSQNVDLPYHFKIDGFDVDVSSAELTTTATAFGRTVEEELLDDERWLGLGVTLVETEGRERLFPWAMVVRLKTALGAITPAPYTFAPEETIAPTDLQALTPFQRKDMHMFFRVKRGDFPIELVFADGAAAPLGQ